MTLPSTEFRTVAGPGEIEFLVERSGDDVLRASGTGSTDAVAAAIAEQRSRAGRRSVRLAIGLPHDHGLAPADAEDLGLRRATWRDTPTTSCWIVDLGPTQVRLAAPDDLAAVGALTAEGYLADDLVPAEHEYVDELRDAADRAARATLLVAVDERGTPVGTVTVCRHGDPYAELAGAGDGEIRMLAVAPGARGRGIGEALVHASLDLAGAAGDRQLVLSTQPAMLAARRVYERLGFVRTPELDWSPVPGIDLEAMARPVWPGPAAVSG